MDHRVSFFRTARDAAAMEYGRVRAEKYGRRAKAGAFASLLLGALLLAGIVAAAQGAFGG
jgi:hypothetical protein